MKKLGFLFSVLTLMMMAQNMQTVADDKCTTVTVTYVGGAPDLTREVAAWHVTKCNKNIEEHYVNFNAPSQTLSFKNTIGKKNEEIAIGPPGANPGLPITLAGSPVYVVCTCDGGICGLCAEISPQTKRKK